MHEADLSGSQEFKKLLADSRMDFIFLQEASKIILDSYIKLIPLDLFKILLVSKTIKNGRIPSDSGKPPSVEFAAAAAEETLAILYNCKKYSALVNLQCLWNQEQSRRGAQIAVFEHTDKTLQLPNILAINCHILKQLWQPGHGDGQRLRQQLGIVYTALKNSPTSQIKEANTLVQHFRYSRVIIAGDLNQALNNDRTKTTVSKSDKILFGDFFFFEFLKYLNYNTCGKFFREIQDFYDSCSDAGAFGYKLDHIYDSQSTPKMQNQEFVGNWDGKPSDHCPVIASLAPTCPLRIGYDFDGVINSDVTEPDSSGQVHPNNYGNSQFENTQIYEKIRDELNNGCRLYIITSRTSNGDNHIKSQAASIEAAIGAGAKLAFKESEYAGPADVLKVAEKLSQKEILVIHTQCRPKQPWIRALQLDEFYDDSPKMFAEIIQQINDPAVFKPNFQMFFVYKNSITAVDPNWAKKNNIKIPPGKHNCKFAENSYYRLPFGDQADQKSPSIQNMGINFTAQNISGLLKSETP